jgi:hypothetical protein
MSYSNHRHVVFVTALRLLAVVSFASVALSGCSTPGYTVQAYPVAAPPPPPTEIYFYPTRGQSETQQKRDHYECYVWAEKQSGFNPHQAQLAPHQRLQVTPISPPGTDTAVGAVSGAMIGSILFSPHGHGEGMVFGALTGALLGAASDSARQQQAEHIQQQYDSKDAQQYARVDKQARDFRRAISACLEGRGYSVR